MNFLIGIDPGVSGGAVLMNEYGSLLRCLAGGDDELEMLAFLRKCKDYASVAGDSLRAVIEFQQPWPGIAAKANFRVGIGYGFWQGLLIAQAIGYETVRAQDWQRIITKRKGWSRAELKKALVAEALRRWPELAAYRKGQQSGLADAALIAEFARTRGR